MSWLPSALGATATSGPARRLMAGAMVLRRQPALTSRCIHSGTRAAAPHSAVPHLPHHLHHRPHASAAKTSDPLHILFCGSDEFSCAVLETLHREHVENPALVRSINVVLRPGKPMGRGYKSIREPPIRGLAKRLGLQMHERDTFTGWSMPGEINLIVAVSFGLFVPPRLLSAAKYGGLNLHPSLLPDLRGPAPLQHALLAGRSLTGVSLQTLDHDQFDHGMVLAQTPADPEHEYALRIPRDCTTVAGLQALVTPVAAQMLVQALRAGLHVPPLEDRGWTPDAAQRAALLHAPKITKKDRQVTLAMIRTCEEDAPAVRGTLARRQDAIGPLWFWSRDREGTRKRIIIEELEELADASLPPDRPSMVLEGATATRTLQPESAFYRRYFVPFEEEDADADTDAPGTHRTGKNLVFWSAVESPASADGTVEVASGEELCLGRYRILSAKVEGANAKPTRLALHRFLL
ncbi:formyl transferase [Xylariaceae sp. FL0594]|nr:formyl transferase [Xylariaceae sp. FL0594]